MTRGCWSSAGRGWLRQRQWVQLESPTVAVACSSISRQLLQQQLRSVAAGAARALGRPTGPPALRRQAAPRTHLNCWIQSCQSTVRVTWRPQKRDSASFQIANGGKKARFVRRGLAGIEPTPARPNGAGYARLNLSATAGMEASDMVLRSLGHGSSVRQMALEQRGMQAENAGGCRS